MSRDAIFDNALITSVIRYGEADCIVRLFLRQWGRTAVFYKNGFLISAKKPHSIQSPAFADLSFVPNNHGKLARLKSLDLDPNLFELSKSLRGFAHFIYLAEIIEIFLPEDEPAMEIFDLVRKVYEKMLQVGTQAQMLRAFELKLLKHAGLLPDLQDDRKIVAYDPIDGSFLTEYRTNTILFGEQELALANALVESPIDEIFCNDIDLLKAVAKLFFCRLKLLKKGQLKSIAFLRQLDKK